MNALCPIFSVVIPVYNKRQMLPNMLRSVLAQTCTDFEIVIVDDGSTDNSIEAIRPLLDNRCHVFKQTNRGVSEARNRGLSEARGRYVALLDADDYWFPDHLETAHQFFSLHPEIRWYGASWIKSAATELVRSMPRAAAHYEIHNYFASGHLAAEHPVWTSAVIFAKDMVAEKPLFPEDLCLNGEDLYAWYSLGARSPDFGWTPRVTSVYVRSDTAIFPSTRGRTTYVTRMLDDFPALANPNNRCLRQHIELWLHDHLQRGKLTAMRKFLADYRTAMALRFRLAWWTLATIGRLVGGQHTARWLAAYLSLKRKPTR